MPRRNWLILTALAMEAQAIRRALPIGSGIVMRVIGPRATGLSNDYLKNSQGVILAGLAGGLDPTLRVGDVVIEAGGEHRVAKLQCIWGRIHTSDCLVSTPTQKAALFAETSASAVDMESSIVRLRADAVGLPLVVIRGISDAANDSIPPQMIHWIDSAGQPKPASIALGLLKNPALIFSAMRLRKNSNLALTNMANAVRQCIESFSIPSPTAAIPDP
jgi:adenosylhomocysteine nucleosidase